MDAITIEGKLTIIEDVQRFDSGFEKQAIIIDAQGSGKYPNPLKVEWLKAEKIELISKLEVGMDVSVEANLNGNEYNGKHYVSLSGWKINSATGGETTTTTAKVDDEEDIPF